MLLPAAEKLHLVYEILPINSPVYFDVFYVLIVISGLAYTVWSLVLLRNHYTLIKENFSYTEKINLKWLRNLCIGMAVIWLAVTATSFMEENLSSSIIFTTATLFVFLIGYYGIRQGVIFTDSLTTAASVSQDVKGKYQKSPLDATQSKSLLKRLLLFMEKEKPYLESKITLPQLASQFDTNPNYLSQIINESLNQNLYDFINKYRVDEFKEKLENADALNYTLFGLAQDCGFSSKSTFYDVFKKHTGQTPAQYQSTLVVTSNH
jgi:AraC-like DNA-binding protein